MSFDIFHSSFRSLAYLLNTVLVFDFSSDPRSIRAIRGEFLYRDEAQRNRISFLVKMTNERWQTPNGK